MGAQSDLASSSIATALDVWGHSQGVANVNVPIVIGVLVILDLPVGLSMKTFEH
jgi:hypothetical protein